MAPYNPPNTHYSQIDVSTYDQSVISKVMGAHGTGFYNLTKKLKLKYLWFNNEKGIVELWGPYSSLLNGAAANLKVEFENATLTN